MSILDDFLTSGGGNAAPVDNSNVQYSTPPQDAPPVDPSAVTTVAPVTVTAPPMKPINYDNSADATAVQQSLQNLPKPQGGGVNPGVWGLLPPNIQHGSLRNILGALGDAFLVSSGKQAQYEPRMERQQEGQAMAGYANRPEAAIERMAATGTPDAMKNSVAMQDNLNNLNLHQDQLTAQNQYRQDSLDQRKQAQTDSAQARDDNVIARMTPYVGGQLSSATTPAQYAAAYQNAERMAQRVNPRYHAEDFGAVDPQDWKPGQTIGTTANQDVVSADKAAQRGVSTANNVRTTNQSNVNNQRSTGASVGNNQRTVNQSNVNNQRTTGTSTANNERTTGAAGTAGGLHPSTTASSQKLTPAQAQRLPAGTHFIGTDGKEYVKH